ncbi:TPA: hypothetical protein ACNTUM_000663 [Escherichia coli]|nr:hypothetical protein [Escherichia coli]HCO3884100.1 hypothetical protein [Escherichia coli]
MAKIIVKEGRDNSRNRRREQRRKEREAKKLSEQEARKLEMENAGGLPALKAAKAIDSAVVPVKDEIFIDDQGGDAMNLVVNHAHQRDPRKKW